MTKFTEKLLRRSPAFFLIAILLGVVFTSTAFFPGYMSNDSIVQLAQGREGKFVDWHPPVMSWLWGVLDKIYAGPAPMLVLHNLVFWGGLGLFLSSLFGPTVLAGILVLAIGLMPPVFGILGTIWKDVGMGAAFVLAVGCLSTCSQKLNRSRPAYWFLIFVALVSIWYACAVRHNAAAAALPLLVWLVCIVAQPVLNPKKASHWLGAIVAAAALLASLYVGGKKVTLQLTDGKTLYPVQQILIHDLVAVSIEKNEVLLPQYLRELSNQPTIEELKRIYNPANIVDMFCCDNSTKRLVLNFDENNINELTKTWAQVIPSNLGTYLTHRSRVFAAQLSLQGPTCYPFHTEITGNDLGVSLNRSALNSWVNRKWLAMKDDFYFRGWFYVGLGFLRFGFSLRRLAHRYQVPRSVAELSLASSALLYALPYFFVSTTCDLRMLWWPVCATLMALAVVVHSKFTARFAGQQ